MDSPVIAVTSGSFSKSEVLREELREHFPKAYFNDSGSRMEPDELIEFLSSASGAVIGLDEISGSVLARLPSLRIVAKYGVGLDNIDSEACERHGVRIGWVGGVNKDSVAEQTLAMMINLSRNLVFNSNKMKEGVWNKEGGRSLSELTIGIIGLGHIGKSVARLLKSFGSRVLANDVLDIDEYCQNNQLVCASKERIFRECDMVTLHTPLTPETKYLIDKGTLSQMKSSAYLVNTSRGPCVHLVDLVAALDNGEISGAAIDVFDPEPPQDRALISHPRLIATPHTSGNSQSAILAMGRSAINSLSLFFAG